jgi:hypothetical protein
VLEIAFDDCRIDALKRVLAVNDEPLSEEA